MNRNITLDYFKLFLSILVITIHMVPLFSGRLELLGWFLSGGIARIAVPCFFIINGYFIGKNIRDRAFVKKYLLHLIIILAAWTLVYSFLLFTTMSPIDIIPVLLTGYYHLWYLVGLIVAILILRIFNYMEASRRYYSLLTVSVLLFIAGYFLQEYVRNLSLGFSLKLIFYRNGLFVGFPFVFLGYFIKEKEAELHRLKTCYVWYITTFGLIALLGEIGLAAMQTKNNDIFLSLFVLCPALFVLLLKYSHYKDDDGYIGKLASGVFFVHILIWRITVEAFDFPFENQIIIFPVVLFLSMIASAGIIELNKRIKLFL